MLLRKMKVRVVIKLTKQRAFPSEFCAAPESRVSLALSIEGWKHGKSTLNPCGSRTYIHRSGPLCTRRCLSQLFYSRRNIAFVFAILSECMSVWYAPADLHISAIFFGDAGMRITLLEASKNWKTRGKYAGGPKHGIMFPRCRLQVQWSTSF